MSILIAFAVGLLIGFTAGISVFPAVAVYAYLKGTANESSSHGSGGSQGQR